MPGAATKDERGLATLETVLMITVLVPLLFAARAWGAASGGPRGVRVVACAASVLGAAFLVLEHTGHLDALGL